MSVVPFYDRILDELRETGGAITQSDADARYVNVAGDTMVGDLNFPATGFTIVSASGGPTTGNPIGLLLALTYSSGASGSTYRVTVDGSGTLTTTLI